MKKLASTFGLLVLLLVVTSFTTPTEIVVKNTPTDLRELTNFYIGGENTPTDLREFKFSIGGKNTPIGL